MDNTQRFFIDVLKLIQMDENCILLVQAPYEELNLVFDKISYKHDTYQFIKLNRKNIEILLFEIVYNDFESYIQNAIIMKGDKKIFEGFDGMEYGMFSKSFNLSEDFKNKYLSKEMIFISKDW